MSKCCDCKYYQKWRDEYGSCSLTHHIVHREVDRDCSCFNRDLSEYDICYNCKYYGGGHDWGLFCSHKEKYHHLGKFNDNPCEFYQKR